METDKEKLQRLVANTPPSVFHSLYLSLALGALLGLRGILLWVVNGNFTAKSFLFTATIAGFFVFNGFSLMTKSRFSYVLLVAFTFPHVAGSVAGTVHLGHF